jgi:WD40-like Beta Propeller Repeat
MWLFPFLEHTMHAGINRRSATLGLGAVAALTAFNGCGGGGASSGGGAGTSGMTGSIWYRTGDSVLMVPGGGTGAPQFVVKADGGALSSSRPQISRKSPRYLQFTYSGGTGSGESTLLQTYDHGSNQPYCYLTVAGYVTSAFVSPSGNFIAMQRSPDIVNASTGSVVPGVENIIGLNVADISNPNSPTLIRSEFQKGPSCVLKFAWLNDDQFLYMTLDGTMVLGSASAGIQGDKTIGRLIDQGMRVDDMSVHPDGATMLVALYQANAVPFVGDIYLYKTTGELIDQMTATSQGSAPRWSPDGKYFMFSHGTTGTCNGYSCASTCESLYAPSDLHQATLSNVQKFNRDNVPCVLQTFWSSIA